MLVAPLLERPLQVAQLPLVGIGHRIAPLHLETRQAESDIARMARILIATDAWHPQVNGVVRTLDTTASYLREFGHAVEIVEPGPFASVAVPFYPEIAVACPRPGRIYDR